MMGSEMSYETAGVDFVGLMQKRIFEKVIFDFDSQSTLSSLYVPWLPQRILMKESTWLI